MPPGQGGVASIDWAQFAAQSAPLYTIATYSNEGESPSPPGPLQEAGLNINPRKRRVALEKDSKDPIADIFGIPEPYIPAYTQYISYFPDIFTKPQYKLIAPKTLVGIEVEVENVHRIDPNVLLALWSMKDDGSLRNRGREFVTPGAIPMSIAEGAFKLLFGGLNKTIDFSRRTSIHVHLDARQLQYQQLLGLLFTYSAVENLLFKFVGNNRRNSIFCVPLIETGLMEQIGYNPASFILGIENNWRKYTALNLLPISTFGSIEFRHMPGTNNIEHLMHWLDLIACLKVFAYKHTSENIVDSITRLNSNSRYQQFVESIFGDRCLYLDMSNLLSDMEKAVYLIKHCSASNAFNKYVNQCNEHHSQLGKRLNSWIKKLSIEQRAALAALARTFRKEDDLETLFKSILETPGVYKRLSPEVAANVDILIKFPKKVEKTQLLTP